MLNRFAEFYRHFDPLRGPGLCFVDDDGDKGGGGEETVTLSKKAFDARLKRVANSARKKFLEEYELTEDELAAIVAGRGQDADKKAEDKKPGDPEKKPAKPLTFDPEAFKADLLKTVGETVKSALSERDTAAQQKAQAETEKATLRAAAEKAGVKALDLAMPLYEAHRAGLDEEKRKALKPEDWFGQLVKDHPTLGAVKETPADSGKNGNDKPDPAKGGDGKQFDATKAKPAEVAARLNEIRAKVASQH